VVLVHSIHIDHYIMGVNLWNGLALFTKLWKSMGN